MSHQVALSFEDGVTRFITVAEGQTVADASYRARINIPLDCRDGACGTCKAFCESGEYDGGTYIDDALAPDEAEKGYCLPCMMVPKSDLVLQVASTSAVAKTQAASFPATVTALRHYSPTTVGFTISIPDRDKLVYLPGQYVNIAVPGTESGTEPAVSRSYSFSSGPNDADLEFLVKITPGGAMSTYLAERAQVGDTFQITGPNGSFFLRETDGPALMLAGGTGLAPMLAMLRSLRDAKSARRVHLVLGVNTDDDVVELDTLRALQADLPNFTWDYCVMDPASTAANKGPERAYVTHLIDEAGLDLADTAVYLCGPPPMVDAVRRFFDEAGIEPPGFYYEKFALAAGAEPARATAAGAASTATAPAAETAAEPEGAVTSSAQYHRVIGAGAHVHGADEEHGDELAEQFRLDIINARPATPLVVPAAEGAATGDGVRDLITDPDARAVARQELFPGAALDGLRPLGPGGDRPAPVGADDPDVVRAVARQRLFAAGGAFAAAPADGARVLDPEGTAGLITDPDARSITRQELFPAASIEPLVTRPAAAEPAAARLTTPAVVEQGADAVGAGGYVIGQEHPDITKSDAIFEARCALELGALQLTIGRLTSGQLAGYRLLADATVPCVAGDRFVDAAAYTETNAAFHDYLFHCTGNEHLLQAYQHLGVKGAMSQTLAGATWCHPDVAVEHQQIVEAFEAGDRQRAHDLIALHAEHSKETMRRAMEDRLSSTRPRFVSPGRFEGKVVLVTGAAQGIGEAVARRIVAEGGRCVLADRSELVRDVATDATSDGPGSATAVIADLETYDGAAAVVAAAREAYGPMDVAVHNVGGAIWFKPFEQFTPEQIDAEIRRSLMTTLYGCRAVLPGMIEAGGGTIVNVSSVATGGINRAPYAAAKGAVNALTRALAVEAAPHGVRVVATAPGGTDAPARRIPRGPAPQDDQERAWYQEHIDQTIASSLLNRYGTLDEQAAAICFLASEEAGYITGSILPVGGGDLG